MSRGSFFKSKTFIAEEAACAAVLVLILATAPEVTSPLFVLEVLLTVILGGLVVVHTYAYATWRARLDAHAATESKVEARADQASSTQSGEAAQASPSQPEAAATADQPPAAEAESAQEDEAPEPSAPAEEADAVEGTDAEPTGIVPSDAIAPEEDPAFDYVALLERFEAAEDTFAEMKAFVGEVRTRQAAQTGGLVPADAPSVDDLSAPTAFELWLCRLLLEGGLFTTMDELPAVALVRPRRTGLCYLRIQATQLTYDAMLHVVKIEAALNAALLAWDNLEDPLHAPEEELYRYNQRILNSVCAQLTTGRLGYPSKEDEPDGEWAVRHAISRAIESVVLPYRLAADFRTNVSAGQVALKIDLTPARAFASSSYSDGIGIVSTTNDMRRIAASHYALRLGILLSECAIRSSQKITDVWAMGVVDTPIAHRCYYSVHFTRDQLEAIDLANVADPVQVYLDAGASIHLLGPADGSFTYDGYYVHDSAILLRCAETFSLEDERFCPPARYDRVRLSPRRLSKSQAEALGTSRVSGLAIQENDARRAIADEMMHSLGTSTEKSVRAILASTRDDADPSVQDAASRTVGKLIEGTIQNDPEEIWDEFVSGEAIYRAVESAQDDFAAHDLESAARHLEEGLRPYDEAGNLADTSAIAYRGFDNYVDRGLYNRLYADDKRTVMLVPEGYLEAHLLLTVALLGGRKDAKGALAHARRAYELSPLNTTANINLVGCLEANDLTDEAMQTLTHLLTIAHDPQGIAFGYYQMAHYQWKAGNVRAAAACYQRCIKFMPAALPLLTMELTMLAVQGDPTLAGNSLSDEESGAILKEAGIPISPTQSIEQIFLEELRASMDAEVFPVAKSFLNLLGYFSGDDVIFGVMRSMEGEPDR